MNQGELLQRLDQILIEIVRSEVSQQLARSVA